MGPYPRAEEQKLSAGAHPHHLHHLQHEHRLSPDVMGKPGPLPGRTGGGGGSRSGCGTSAGRQTDRGRGDQLGPCTPGAALGQIEVTPPPSRRRGCTEPGVKPPSEGSWCFRGSRSALTWAPERFPRCHSLMVAAASGVRTAPAASQLRSRGGFESSASPAAPAVPPFPLTPPPGGGDRSRLLPLPDGAPTAKHGWVLRDGHPERPRVGEPWMGMRMGSSGWASPGGSLQVSTTG